MNLDYQEYLKTPHWQEIRLRVLESGNNECAKCHSQVDLAVHHKNYENIGKEINNDLIILCEVCHTKHHNAEKYPVKFGELFNNGIFGELKDIVNGTLTREAYDKILAKWKGK